MELTGSSLLLLADGRRARLFEERLRGGPLTEITDRLGDLAAEAPVASGSGGRSATAWGAHRTRPEARDRTKSGRRPSCPASARGPPRRCVVETTGT